jgi:hypothetical protein
MQAWLDAIRNDARPVAKRGRRVARVRRNGNSKRARSGEDSEQSVNNSLPNTRYQQDPIRATYTKNPRGQTPALTYEPGGRTFESCWAHQINNLERRVSVPEPVVNNCFATEFPTLHSEGRRFRNRPDSAPIALRIA